MFFTSSASSFLLHLSIFAPFFFSSFLAFKTSTFLLGFLLSSFALFYLYWFILYMGFSFSTCPLHTKFAFFGVFPFQNWKSWNGFNAFFKLSHLGVSSFSHSKTKFPFFCCFLLEQSFFYGGDLEPFALITLTIKVLLKSSIFLCWMAFLLFIFSFMFF